MVAERVRGSGADAQPTTPEKLVTSSHVRTQSDLARLADGPDPVHVHGVYRQHDVRKRQKGAPVYRGHALIELSDGHRVLLEPIGSDLAIRPEAERALDGQEVVATGRLLSRPPESEQAQIVMPTLSPVSSVTTRE